MGLMKKLTSVAVTAGLLVSLVGTAFAATPTEMQASAKRMQDLGIVNGDPGTGDLRLGDSITRAEFVKIVVWAYGKKADAALLKGAPVFSDSATSWASGEIALAKAMIEKNGYSLGMGDGTFAPQSNLKVSEAVAFIMKFLGAPADKTQSWPQDYIKGAEAAGILSADDVASISGSLNTAAQRGLVFYLADKAFSTYNIGEGKTVYTKYVVPEGPKVTVNTPAATTTEAKVTVTGSVSNALEVYVGSPANQATISNGQFTADVALTMGENDLTVYAKDLAGNVTTVPGKITRTAGTAASIAVPASLSVAAGESADLAVAVKDAAGNVISDAPVEVTSDLGTFADGKFTAGTKTGTGTVEVKSGDLTASVPVTVTAGALAKLVVSPATVDLATGGSQKFTVEGQDANGNAVAAPAVTWTTSKGIIAQDGSFGATSDATGTITVTATSADGKATGTATVTVFGAATKITAAAPAGLVANGESTGDLVISVVDANGNVAKGYNGTLNVVSNSNTILGALPSSTVAVTNGVGHITLTAGSTDGSAAISISGTGLTGYVVPVTVGKQTVASVKVSIDPATLAADNTSKGYLNAELIDQTGNPVLTGNAGYTVDFVVSDTNIVSGTGLTGAILGSHDGQIQLDQANLPYVTSKNALGSATVTATVKYNGVVSSTVTANSVSVSTALVGVPYKLAIDSVSDAKAYVTSGTGDQQKVVVRVLDVNGNQVTGDSISNVTLALTGLSTATGMTKSIDAADVTSASKGVTGGKAQFVVKTNKVATLSYTVTGTNGANTLTQATATGNFVAGAAAGLTLKASPSTIAATGNAMTSLTAKVVDGASNAVTDGTYSVKFVRKSGGNAVAGWTDQTVSTVSGVATVTVTGTANVADDGFQASTTINGATVYDKTTAPWVTVSTRIIGVANQLQFANSSNVLQNGGTRFTYPNATAGQSAKVYVATVDASGSNIVSYDNTTVVTLTATDNDGDGASTTYTATAVNGIATFSLTLNTADDYELNASASGLTGANGTDNQAAVLPVVAGDATGLKVASNSATLGADGSQATLKISLVDAYGNTTNNGGDLSGLTIQSNAPAIADVVYGTVSYYTGTDFVTGPTGDPSLAKSAKVQVASTRTPGSVTVTVSKSGLTSASTSLTTAVVGTPARVSVTVDQSYAASKDPDQKVTVTVLDANGNRVTNYEGYIKLEATSDASTAVVYNSNKTDVNSAPVYVYGNTNAGAYSFYVYDTKAETVTYTAKLTNNLGELTANTSAGTATGSFTAGSAAKVGLKLSPKTASSDTYASVPGDGSSTAFVTVQVQDAYGNLVSDATGSVKVQITNGLPNAYVVGADSAGVLTTDISGGQAVIMVQSRDYAAGNVDLNVQYYKTGASSATYNTDFAGAVHVTAK